MTEAVRRRDDEYGTSSFKAAVIQAAATGFDLERGLDKIQQQRTGLRVLTDRANRDSIVVVVAESPTRNTNVSAIARHRAHQQQRPPLHRDKPPASEYD